MCPGEQSWLDEVGVADRQSGAEVGVADRQSGAGVSGRENRKSDRTQQHDRHDNKYGGN